MDMEGNQRMTDFEYEMFEMRKAKTYAIENQVSVMFTHKTKGAQRCHCGRYKGRQGPCSLEFKVYRDGSFMGWEHY